MDNFITRPEHEEFCRRVDAEEKRQNRRLELLEDNVQKIAALTRLRWAAALRRRS